MGFFNKVFNKNEKIKLSKIVKDENEEKNNFNSINNLFSEKLLTENEDFNKYHQKMENIPHDLKKEAKADSFFKEGITAHECGNLIKAAKAYQACVEYYPYAYGAYINLGRVYEEQGKTQMALEIYQKGMDLAPFDHDGYGKKGHLLLMIDKHQEAQYNLRKAISLQPDNLEYITNYACAHICLKKYDEAQSALELVLKINPNYPAAKLNRDSLIKAGIWK